MSVGSSWKNWNTTPTLRPRQSASAFSPRPREIRAGDAHASRRGPVESRDQVEQRGLAAARFAEDRDVLAGGDRERDAAQRREALAAAQRKCLLHAFELDHEGRFHRAPTRGPG